MTRSSSGAGAGATGGGSARVGAAAAAASARRASRSRVAPAMGSAREPGGQAIQELERVAEGPAAHALVLSVRAVLVWILGHGGDAVGRNAGVAHVEAVRGAGAHL